MAVINGNNSGTTLTGTDGDDQIFGNGGSDILIGLRGRDQLSGGTGADIFDYNGLGVFSETAFGEAIDGGTETDTIRLEGSVNFTDMAISSIERIEFRSGTATASHRADFTASQFNSSAGRISDAAAISGSAGDQNTLQIAMGAETTLDLTGLAFSNWDADDRIRVSGDSSNEIIALSSAADTVSAGGGADRLLTIGAGDNVSAGSGDDRLFLEGALGRVVIDGGTGIDTLAISGQRDLRTSALANVDKLLLGTANTTFNLHFTSAQFASGNIAPDFTIGAPRDPGSVARGFVTIDVGAAFDASAWTFGDATSFTFAAGVDALIFEGGAAENVITGSARSDILRGFGGKDTLTGGAGRDLVFGGDDADILIVNAQDDTGADIYDGGNGADTLVLSTGGVDYGIRVSNIETLQFTGAAGASSRAFFQFSLAGNLRSTLTSVAGSDGRDLLDINRLGVDVDLRNVTFTNWSDEDSVQINGGSTAGNFFGSAVNDFIIGSGSSDLIDSGAGRDNVEAGGGADTIVIDSAAVAGEFFGGGNESDTLLIDRRAGGIFSLNALQFSSIEEIAFATGPAGPASLFIDAAQVNGGLAANLKIIAADDSILVAFGSFSAETADAPLDLSAIQAVGWTARHKFEITGGGDSEVIKAPLAGRTAINGQGGNDVITGSDFDDASGGFASGNDVFGDVINGGAGRDEMHGGGGHDRFIAAGDSAPQANEIWDGGAGSDQILVDGGLSDFRTSQVNSIESLDLRTNGGSGPVHATFDSGQIGFGLALDSFITGKSGEQAILDIRIGAIRLVDLSGFSFSSGFTQGLGGPQSRVAIVGSALNDNVTGSAAIDSMSGGAGIDTLKGGGGDDRIDGGADGDRLTGGAGRDVFTYEFDTDSAAASRDLIRDFVSGDDIIDLRRIDANELIANNQQFLIDTDGSFSAGEIRIRQTATQQIIDINTDADAAAETQIVVTGISVVTGAGDFLL